MPYDPVRGPASLLALAASYTIARPAAAVGGAMEAIAVGLRVRRAPILRPHPQLLARPDELVPVCSLVSDDVQLDEVEQILAARRGPVLLIAHHHMWRDALFLQPDEWSNTALDADRLARILFAYQRRAPGNRVLVCHGHRHTRTCGRISDGTTTIDIVGLPSSTLGDKADTGVHDGELRYAIAGLRADGTWGVALVGAGALTARERAARAAGPGLPGAALRALSPDLMP